MNFFISFEGPEGSGKSTQADLLTDYLREKYSDVLLTREPGGTSIGEEIRDILLDPENDIMNSRTELFLYAAARRQHVSETIKPALEEGKIVITDRYSDATLVYQGMARELDLSKVRKINDYATNGLSPDLTFILDVPTDQGLSSVRNSDNQNEYEIDRIERENIEFHRRVRESYQKIAEQNPDRCIMIERDKSIETIQETIRNHTQECLSKIEN